MAESMPRDIHILSRIEGVCHTAKQSSISFDTLINNSITQIENLMEKSCLICLQMIWTDVE